MDAATLCPPTITGSDAAMMDVTECRVVDAAEFRQLLVSHRRMVRADRRHERLRGLQDLDTGEVFLVDERQLLSPSL
jgi:hypothetical protein